MQEDKPRDDANGEVQEVEVKLTQPLQKDWRYATSHVKYLIIGDISKGINNKSRLHDICGHLHSYHT